jgi:hypothetical protein
MSYRNFKASIYCTVGDLLAIQDISEFDREFQLIDKNVKVGKVYLETFRGGVTISRDQMEQIKEYFLNKGIEVAGGITPVDHTDKKEGGFHSFCYTTASTRELFVSVMTMTAELFDEIILDDFYFTNCRCEECITAKGSRSWSEYRLSLMQEISEEIILKTARQVNPRVKVIIKYPNWYEHYQETGYNLAEQPAVFDYIYTGTETRNPAYSQQHLPKYLSYFIMRYLENVAPNRNLGGWFDPFESSYNLTSYLDQNYLTLFAKAKEVTLFCLGALLRSKTFRNFAPAVGQSFKDVDRYFMELGQPIGVATYIPYHSSGEDYLHNYLGMCGIPFEPYPSYPEDAGTIFLSENAAYDPDIIVRMQQSLKRGADIMVTSGFVRKLGASFTEFMNVTYTTRKALANRYLYSADGGVTINGSHEAANTILIPQLDYFTNDVWEMAGAFGEENNFPILLKTFYSNGRVFVLTIPDDSGNLYHYPPVVHNTIRAVLSRNLPVQLEGNPKVTLFVYDNDTFILRSFLPYMEKVTFTVRDTNISLLDLENNKTYTGIDRQDRTVFDLHLQPGENHVLRIIR